MAETKTVNLEVNSNLGQTEQAVTSLRSELRKAQADVAAMSDKFGATSKEAIEAAKRAADLKDRIGDAKDLTDAFNPDAKFKALAGAANIAAGALAGFEGAMGMVGVQSEDAQQAILKVQSALAVSQGLDVLQQIPDTFRNIKAVAVNAFGAIKGAIGATGIGLLVVALGALYANWDALKKLVGDSVPALKEGSKQFDKLKEVFFGVGNAIIQYLIAPIKAVLKLLKLDFKGAINEIKNGYDVIGNYEKGAAKERQDQNDAYAKARLEKQIKNKENEIAIAKASGRDSYNLEKDNLHRKLLLNKDNQEELEKLRQEERLLDATHKKSLEDKQKSHNDELKKKQEEAAAEAKRLREEKQKEEQDLAKEYRDKQRDAAFKSLDEIEKATKENADRLKTDKQKAIDDENERFQKSKEDAEAAGMLPEQIEELEIQHLNNLNDINLTSQKKDYENEKANSDAKIKIAEEEAAAKQKTLQSISSGLKTAASLLGESTAAGKAAAIAATTIDTIQSGVSAYKGMIASVPGPVGIALGAVAAAGALASGYASVKKILAVKTPGSGGGGGGASVGAAPTPPSFNVVGQGGANQIAESMNRQAETPMQAYVVAQNVTTAQSLNRNIVSNASLG
jgi:DNA repair exonuclease SbcCD ATPase subunit